MSLRTCAWRLQRPVAGLRPALTSSRTIPGPLLRQVVQRSISTSPSSRAPKQDSKAVEEEAEPEEYTNPIIQDYLKKRPKHLAQRPTIQQGDLASDSIFGEEEGKAKDIIEQEKQTTAQDGGKVELSKRNPDYMRMALDPDPVNRRRWERKMVIRRIQKRGKLSKEEILKQTERQSLTKSPFFKTSIKKLTKIANQIAGKTIDEAILQMRFSKKKVAQDVKGLLEYARNEAIVKRGMGLAKTEGAEAKPLEIELKNGKSKVVKDPTEIYIDQAWVGRGAFGAERDYRGRGRVYVMRKPFTSISVLLKEEATRVRLHNEREEKRRNRKLWVQLPDRPITAQRQYALW